MTFAAAVSPNISCIGAEILVEEDLARGLQNHVDSSEVKSKAADSFEIVRGMELFRPTSDEGENLVDSSS